MLFLRVCEPDGTWWDRLLCRMFWHVMAPSPDEATFVRTPGGDLFVLCERCGAPLGGP